ncbi:MAG: DUF2200 domain-containing protein [Faecalibacterium sp.]
MTNEQVYAMPCAKVYYLLVNKATRKGRTEAEVQQIIRWMTGYSDAQLAEALQNGTTYGDFFRNAPHIEPACLLVKGSICGVRVETIEELPMRYIRILDKLVDELAKGRPMEKILRKV